MKRVSLKDNGAVFEPSDSSSRHAGPKFKPAPSRKTSRAVAPSGGGDRTFATIELAVNQLATTHGACQGSWTYTDPQGQPLMVMARFPVANDPNKPGKKPKKTFRPIARDGDGWRIGDPPGKLPLYNLPGIATAKPHETIYIVEGEKKADLLISMGFVATTSSHGCGSAHKSDWSPVSGHDLVIMPDHDPGGEAYAVEIVKLVEHIDSGQIKVVKLSDVWPEIPETGDVVDLLAARGGNLEKVRAEILALAKRTAPMAGGLVFRPIGAIDLIHEHPDLRPAVIAGLLRQGEVMNVVAAPKVGKSWIVLALAIATATGRPWLGMATSRGKVLLIDAELHRETLARRLHSTRQTLGVQEAELHDLEVVPLRGHTADIETLAARLERVGFGTYRLIIFDALYRFLPLDGEENANETMTLVYNTLDRIAKLTGACIVVVHHASKGNQAEKSVTDVGSGAGAQSRAPDSHLVLRPHEEEGAVVVDAAVRSFPPVKPFAIRANNPGWSLAPDLDPTRLRKNRQTRKKSEEPADTPASDKAVWTPERFAGEVVGTNPVIREDIIAVAKASGLSKAGAESLLARAEDAGLVHRHQSSPTSKHRFSTAKPVVTPGLGEGWVDPATPPGVLAPGGCGGGRATLLPPFPGPQPRPFEEEHKELGL